MVRPGAGALTTSIGKCNRLEPGADAPRGQTPFLHPLHVSHDVDPGDAGRVANTVNIPEKETQFLVVELLSCFRRPTNIVGLEIEF